MIVSSDPAACGLPHREPFIFIDAVVDCDAGNSATCRKTFAETEPFFRGHFPGDPLVPGVLLTEALAQTAGIAAGQPGKTFRLSAIKQMKFLVSVRPGDVVLLTASRSGEMAGLLRFHVRAQIMEETVAEGEVVLSAV
jgi:3-hydroxyacyl-[acyl-carrier-protein] dehydratase